MEGFRIVEFKHIEKDLQEYHRLGAKKGVWCGFDCVNDFYNMKENGVTDWTGLPQCFTKEQLVHTDKGVKPISEIKKGEKVLCYNENEKINEYKTVTETLSDKKTNQRILQIKLKDGTIIKVTENHLFFTGKEYVKIKDLLLSLPKFKNIIK